MYSNNKALTVIDSLNRIRYAINSVTGDKCESVGIVASDQTTGGSATLLIFLKGQSPQKMVVKDSDLTSSEGIDALLWTLTLSIGGSLGE
jgi:hypothetical protein